MGSCIFKVQRTDFRFILLLRLAAGKSRRYCYHNRQAASEDRLAHRGSTPARRRSGA